MKPLYPHGETNAGGLIATFVLLVTLLFPQWGHTTQLEFHRTQQGQQELLSYLWKDTEAKEHYLKFSLPLTAFNDESNRFRRFSPHYMQREIAMQVQKGIYNQHPGVSIQVLPSGDTLRYQLRAHDKAKLQQAEQTLQTLLEQAKRDYLTQSHLVTLTDPFGREVLIPDHGYFMQQTIPHIQPLVRAITKQQDTKQIYTLINWLLSYVQSLPYAALGKRGDNDYLPPLSVLRTNHGDCDSKAVLLASLIRAIYPDLPLAMIYLPEHALLGIQLGDASPRPPTRIDDQAWLLAEAAGPALLPLGEVADSTQLELDRQIAQINPLQ